MKTPNNINKDLKMKELRKSIKRIYDTDSGVRTYTRQSNFSASQTYTENNLDRLLNSIGSSTMNLTDLKRMSNFAYASDPKFATIINYFSNMFLWRYFYVPVLRDKKEHDPELYEKMYNLMSGVIDGVNIETAFPLILTRLYKEGIVYLYTEKNTSSKTITTYTLDREYCKPVMKTQYGTGIFQFDAQYFDELGLTNDNREEILELYPKELVEGYKSWKNNSGGQFFLIDGRYGTFISLNDFNFPTQLNTLKSLFDYDTYRRNEVTRNSAQLDTIISHKIPSYQDMILFEMEEVEELHKSMSRTLASNERTKLLTTFGEIEVHHLEDNDKVQNEILEKAHDAIFNSAGLNSNLFNGNSSESLKYSLQRDAADVWTYIQQLVSFYNLSINNLYNFKNYQAELNMLPLTHYNLKDFLELYRKNSEYGVGRIELIVASGTKQKHIKPKHELESFLELDKILQPLQSSHTQTGKEVEEEKEVEEKDDPTNNENPEVEDETADE